MDITNSLFNLSGKVAIVTGGSRGIGRSICHELAKHGASVVVSSRKLPACEAVVSEIAEFGGEAHAVSCNIGHQDQVENLVTQATAKYGKVDILICNAAINPYFGPSKDIPDSALDRIFAYNIKSNLWLANGVLPGMVERQDGAIIVVSSIGGLRASTTIGAYAISKAADLQLVRNLSAEYGPHNIRVNAICPGLVRTDFARALWENPEILKASTSSTPLRRIGEPHEMAGAAVFLASPAGSFTSGATIVCDGGQTVT